MPVKIAVSHLGDFGFLMATFSSRPPRQPTMAATAATTAFTATFTPHRHHAAFTATAHRRDSDYYHDCCDRHLTATAGTSQISAATAITRLTATLYSSYRHRNRLYRHEILDANLPPGHDGAYYKNSGHNADQHGVRANRDTFVQNSASNEDFVDTTYSTSAHTSYWV